MALNIKNAFISFRIGVGQWMPENRFQGLLDLFGKYGGVTDEITFFTSDTHAPLRLDTVRERAAILAQRMREIRRRGCRSGVNILATIGHHEENLANSLAGDYTPMTDIDGNICRGSFCPNDDKMRDYIKQLYLLAASADPDYIWIDDDVRLCGHLPICHTCFCDKCLSIFEEEFGTGHTRDTLKEAFNSGTLEEKLKIRKDWLEHNRRTVSRLFALIEKTVHGARPDLPVGFMTGERYFEGYDFEAWVKILSGTAGGEVMWRPGGGFYSDERMVGLVEKAHQIGRQVSLLPDSVVSIQSEVENFPYQRLKKSVQTTVTEAAAHMASGCTGAAFNVLSMYDEPLAEYEPLVAGLRSARGFYDLLARRLGRHKPLGIYTGWNRDCFAVNNIADGEWFGNAAAPSNSSHGNEVFEAGLPVAYGLPQASVTLLTHDMALALKEEEIYKILSTGIYMDAGALVRLNEMGYGELTGFGVDRFLDRDCLEEFAEHALNAGITRYRRDCRQSFWRQSAAVLRPLGVGAEILSRLIDYGDKEKAPCGMGIFQNRLGGRICIAGYYPWIFLQNLSKSSQIKSVMRWLSKDALPAYIASFHKMNIWARKAEKGKISIAILNSSLDPATDTAAMIHTDLNECDVYDMHCGKTRVRAGGSTGPYKKFILPVIGPWEMRLIELK